MHISTFLGLFLLLFSLDRGGPIGIMDRESTSSQDSNSHGYGSDDIGMNSRLKTGVRCAHLHCWSWTAVDGEEERSVSDWTSSGTLQTLTSHSS